MPGLLTGTIDPETRIPELVTKMEAAGIDAMIEDANSQISAWQ